VFENRLERKFAVEARSVSAVKGDWGGRRRATARTAGRASASEAGTVGRV